MTKLQEQLYVSSLLTPIYNLASDYKRDGIVTECNDGCQSKGQYIDKGFQLEGTQVYKVEV